MAQVVKLKRTSVQGRIPTISNLELGELAINTHDGRIFFEKDDGTLSIQEILTTNSQNSGSFNLQGAISASSLSISGDATIDGNLVLAGNITIGDASSDTISFAGELSSDIIPATTNTYDLGSSTFTFSEIHSTNLYGAINATNGVVSGSSQVVIGDTNGFNEFSSSISSSFNGLSSNYVDLVGIPSGIVSSSVQVISLLPNGTISGSSQVTITESQISDLTHYGDSDVKSKLDTEGVVSGSSQVTISNTIGFTSFSSSVDTSIQTEKGRIDAILASSDADKDSFAEIVTLINSVDTTNDQAFASFYTASNDRFDSIESFTSSIDTTIKTKLDTDGVISGSSQVVIGDTDGFTSFSSSVADTFDGLTSNYDELVGIPSGIVSGSSQLTSSFDTRYLNVSGEGNISGSFSGSFTGDGSGLTNLSVDVGETTTVTSSFDNVSSVSVAHSFDSRNVIVSVYDTNYSQIIPQEITLTDNNTVDIVLSDTGSGHIVLAKGGHVVSGSRIQIDEITSINDTFTDETSYTVNHSFETKNVFVSVYGTNDEQIIPATVSTPTTSSIQLGFDNPTSGRVVIGKAGHIVSGTIEGGGGTSDFTELTNVPSGLVSSSAQVLGGSNVVSGSTDWNLFHVDILGNSDTTTIGGSDEFVIKATTANIGITTNYGEVGSQKQVQIGFSPGDLGTATSGNAYPYMIIHQDSIGDGYPSSASKILRSNLSVLDFADTDGLVSGSSQITFNDVAENPFVSSSNSISASGHFVPTEHETYDLGSTTQRWRDLYLSGSTIDLGGTKISRDSSTGDIEFRDSSNNRKSIKVDELTIGSGASARKIKVNNGKVQFTDESDNVESSETGHVIPSANNTYDLGSPTAQFRDLYLSSASLYIDGTKVLASSAETLTFTTDAGQSIKLLETGGDDIIFQTENGNIELKGTVEVLSGKKIIDSAGTKIEFGDSIGITGSIDLTGTVDGIDLQSFSSSISTQFDSLSTDYGDLQNIPSGIVSGSSQVTTLLNGQDLTLNNLTVDGTQTIIDSTRLAIGDNIIELNGGGATNGGLYVKDVTAPNTNTGSLLWDSTNDYWIGGALGSESKLLRENGDSVISGSSQIDVTQTTNYSSINQYTDSDNTLHLNSLGVISGSSQVDYSSIQNKPTIPTNNNELTNGAGYVDGSGTANYVPKWTDGDTIGNSVIYDDGTNVGIGTSNPVRELEITGTGNVYARITAQTSADWTALELVNTGGGWSMRNNDQNNDALEFVSDTTNALTIQKTGNIGIGNSSPSQKLHVNGIGEFAGAIRITEGGTAQSILIGNQDSGGLNKPSMMMGVNGALKFGWGDSWVGEGGSFTETLQLKNNGDAYFTGNVGIGNSSPSTKLQVDGTVTATSLTETSALRFKENIQEDIDSSIIDKLRPVSYDWKENKEKDYGFIAEEVSELDSILTTKDENEELLGIKYTKLIPFLVKKIQEQEERIKQLENGNS